MKGWCGEKYEGEKREVGEWEKKVGKRAAAGMGPGVTLAVW